MATDYDYVDKTTGANYFGDGISSESSGKAFRLKRTVNLATAGDTLTSSGAFAVNDVLQLFDVHEGMLVQGVAIEVRTAEGATLNITVGDDDDPDGYITTYDMASTGWIHSGDGTYNGDYTDGTTYHDGRLYTADDTIDMVLATASADTAVFEIYVWGIDMRPVGA